MRYRELRNRVSKKGISSQLTDLYAKIVKKIDDKTPLEDTLAILDRGIKLEQLKHRLQDEDWGKGFDQIGGNDDDDTGS